MLPDPDEDPAVQISAGSDGATICALTLSGQVFCWGYNYFGELGNGSLYDSLVPVRVGNLTSVSAISAGSDHACAIVDGAAYCWGFNSSGELGDGSGADQRLPVPVAGLTSGVTSIASRGAHFSCAIAGGRVFCWGNDAFTPVPGPL